MKLGRCKPRWLSGSIAVVPMLLLPAWAWIFAQEKPDVSHGPDFTRDIQPILAANCYSCHGAKVQMGRLRLDARQTAFAGGQSGNVIKPGDAAGSILMQRVAGTGDQARMPMGGKPLPEEKIALIRDGSTEAQTGPKAQAQLSPK